MFTMQPFKIIFPLDLEIEKISYENQGDLFVKITVKHSNYNNVNAIDIEPVNENYKISNVLPFFVKKGEWLRIYSNGEFSFYAIEE